MNAPSESLKGSCGFSVFARRMTRSTHYLPKFLTLLHLESRNGQVTLCFRNDTITGTAFAYYIVDSLLITGVLTCPMASQVPDQLRGWATRSARSKMGSSASSSADFPKLSDG